MPDVRTALKCLIDGYRQESGSDGDAEAAPIVVRYCNDPEGASFEDFGFVSALTAPRFFTVAITDDQKKAVWDDANEECGCHVALPTEWTDATEADVLAQVLQEGCA